MRCTVMTFFVPSHLCVAGTIAFNITMYLCGANKINLLCTVSKVEEYMAQTGKDWKSGSVAVLQLNRAIILVFKNN